MARETKIGLLAGLAFIICFAVILANRGRQPLAHVPLDYAPSTGTDSLASDRPARVPTPTGFPGAHPDSAGHGTSVASAPDGRWSTPPRTDRNAGFEPAAVESMSPAGESAPARIAWSEHSPSPINSLGRGRDEPAGAMDDSAERVRILEKRLDDLSRQFQLTGRSSATAAQNTASGSIPPPSSPQPITSRADQAIAPTPDWPDRRTPAVVPLTRCTVAAGDTLSAIAARHFGSRSKVLIDALFDANRAVLSDPNQLRVGMEIVIPQIPGFDGQRQSPPPTPTTVVPREHRPDETKTPPDAPIRWYQIRKNEGYINIAREQLGDASRWREIHVLNRDKFPDPEMIREGVRIKLPPVLLTDARKGDR